MTDPFRTASSRSKAAALVRSLGKRRHRDADGLAVAEGPSAVEYAVRVGAVRTVLADDSAIARFRDLLDRAADVGAAVFRVDDPTLRALADTQSPQGLIAVVAIEFATELPREMSLVVILDSVQDPGNVGTIIRSADAFGADVVIFGPGSADPRSAKVVRSSAGSVFDVALLPSDDLASTIAFLRARGVRTLAASGGGSPEYFDAAAAGSLAGSAVAWVFGNEAKGISPGVVMACDEQVAIPMMGRAESLNVGAAASVCLFVARQNLGYPN